MGMLSILAPLEYLVLPASGPLSSLPPFLSGAFLVESFLEEPSGVSNSRDMARNSLGRAPLVFEGRSWRDRVLIYDKN